MSINGEFRITPKMTFIQGPKEPLDLEEQCDTWFEVRGRVHKALDKHVKLFDPREASNGDLLDLSLGLEDTCTRIDRLINSLQPEDFGEEPQVDFELIKELSSDFIGLMNQFFKSVSCSTEDLFGVFTDISLFLNNLFSILMKNGLLDKKTFSSNFQNLIKGKISERDFINIYSAN